VAVFERNYNEQESRAGIDSLVSSQLHNPRFILANMQEGVNKAAPILAELLREGINDGSITTKNPDECAEVFFLLLNVWCDHEIFECDINRLTGRFRFVQQLMKQMGADILSDKTIKQQLKFLEKLYKGSGK